jgi:hypothetical protein
MMRKTPLLLGAFVSFACFACGSVAGPSEPSTSSPSSAAGGAGGGAGTTAGGAAGGANAPATGQPGSTPAPGTTAAGSFGGSYSVPTTAALAAAATFDMPELNWSVENNVATLAYNLPRALVGKLVRVTFTGPFDPATGTATMTGPPGTSTCTVTAATVSCSEAMQGLVPLNPDLAVVTKLASTYAGPVSDRTSLAQQFAGDPIGIALIDLSRPGVPDTVEVEVGGHQKGK